MLALFFVFFPFSLSPLWLVRGYFVIMRGVIVAREIVIPVRAEESERERGGEDASFPFPLPSL